jgi:hypothetical protein
MNKTAKNRESILSPDPLEEPDGALKRRKNVVVNTKRRKSIVLDLGGGPGVQSKGPSLLGSKNSQPSEASLREMDSNTGMSLLLGAGTAGNNLTSIEKVICISTYYYMNTFN